MPSRCVSSRLACLLAFGLLAAIAPPVAGEDIDTFSIWRLEASSDQRNSESGVAFLIDSRGYFLTASHVLHDSAGNYYTDIKLLSPAQALDARKAKLVRDGDLCEEFLLTVNGEMCKKGSDLALVLAESFPVHQYPVLKLSLSGRPVKWFEGIASGFHDDFTTATLADDERFELRTVGEERLDSSSRVFYHSPTKAYDGYSGGPVLHKSTHVVHAVGSWLRRVNAFTPSKDFFSTPIERARKLVIQIESNDQTKQVLGWLTTESIGADLLEQSHLPRLSDLELAHLVRDLGALPNPIIAPYLQRIKQECEKRQLNHEIAALGEYHPDLTLAFRREVARANLVLAEAAMTFGQSQEAADLASTARNHYREFFSAVGSADPQWFGPKTLAATAFDMGRASDLAGLEDSLSWHLLAYQSDKSGKTAESLANRFFRSGEYDEAAYFFAQAAASAPEEPPERVIKGFEDSMARLQTERVPTTLGEYVKGLNLEVAHDQKAASLVFMDLRDQLSDQQERLYSTALGSNRVEND